MIDPRPTTLRDASRVVGHCGTLRCEWNGDRARGWTIYCACGCCTPMARSFTEAMDRIEAQSRLQLATTRGAVIG